MLVINVVVSCSNRKKAEIPKQLRLRSYPGDSIANDFKYWSKELQTNKSEAKQARDLYSGDHWKVASSIPTQVNENFDIRLWIVSAGYGLLNPTDMIKPYSATFTPKQKDSVSYDGNVRDLQKWWSLLTANPVSAGNPRNIYELVSSNHEAVTIIIASHHYITAMMRDIKKAIFEIECYDMLSILSIGAPAKMKENLKPHFLPASARFELVVGGTRASLNVRVGRLLLQSIDPGVAITTPNLAITLDNLSEDLPLLLNYNNKKMCDAEMTEFMSEAFRSDQSVSKTKLLKKLRSSGLACEYQRFSLFFEEQFRRTKK